MYKYMIHFEMVQQKRYYFLDSACQKLVRNIADTTNNWVSVQIQTNTNSTTKSINSTVYRTTCTQRHEYYWMKKHIRVQL